MTTETEQKLINEIKEAMLNLQRYYKANSRLAKAAEVKMIKIVTLNLLEDENEHEQN